MLPPGPQLGGSLFLNCVVEVHINLYLRGVNLAWTTPGGNMDQVGWVNLDWTTPGGNMDQVGWVNLAWTKPGRRVNLTWKGNGKSISQRLEVGWVSL